MRNITKTLFVLITLLFVSCNNNDDDDDGIVEEASLEYTNLKTIEIGDYKIEVPSQFNLIEGGGIDSMVGSVEGAGIIIRFEYGPNLGWTSYNSFDDLDEDLFEVVSETFDSVERNIVIGNMVEQPSIGLYIKDLDVLYDISLTMSIRNLASIEEQNLVFKIFESATLIE